MQERIDSKALYKNMHDNAIVQQLGSIKLKKILKQIKKLNTDLTDSSTLTWTDQYRLYPLKDIKITILQQILNNINCLQVYYKNKLDNAMQNPDKLGDNSEELPIDQQLKIRRLYTS